MKNLKLCAAILLICFEAFSAHADETISLKAGYASITPSGNFTANIGGIPGTTLSDSELGLDRSNNVTAEIAFQLGDGRLSASYLPLKFSGASTLTRNITFNGQTYTTGTPVTSELKADLLDFAYAYYLVNMDDLPSRFQLGLEVSLKYIMADAMLSGGGVTQNASANIPLPTIGARARVALADFIGLSARVGYIGFKSNRFTDADAQIEFSPLPTLGIYGGYRHIDVKLDSSGVIVNTKFAGPYVGAFFRF